MPIGAADRFGPILHASLFNLARVDLTDVLWVGGVCAAVFGLLGWRVDINLFSLHGFYRNRLTRCYLGATRVGQTLPTKIVRKPHPFTGFDPGDDLPLSVLGNQRPFPIVNAAMNLTGGEDLAWQSAAGRVLHLHAALHRLRILGFGRRLHRRLSPNRRLRGQPVRVSESARRHPAGQRGGHVGRGGQSQHGLSHVGRHVGTA